MKKLLLSLCCFLYLTNSNHAFCQNYDWVLTWGDASAQGLSDLKVDSLGNIYTCGYYTSTFDFDPSSAVNQVTGGANGEFYVSKHDSLGNLIWVNGFHGPGVSSIEQMALDNNNSVTVTGYFGDSIDFDPTPLGENYISANSYDCYVLKIDTDGNVEWVHTFGSYSVDQGHNICTDGSNIYVTGRFIGNQDFDPGPGVFNLEPYPYGGQFNTFVLKLNSAGDFVWAGQYGSSWSYGMGYDPTGNILITGKFESSFEAGIGPTVDTLFLDQHSDIFVIKIDTSGNHQWAKSYAGYSYDYGSDLIGNALGEVYVTGGFRYDADFGTVSNPIPLTAGGLYDHFILKLNPDGSTQWVRHVGSDVAIGNALELDPAENIIAVGYFENDDTDFNPGVGDSILINGGQKDIFYQCLNPDGDFLFAGKVGEISGESAAAVAVTKEGKIVIGGAFNGVTDFDPGTGVQQEYCQGQVDPYILKLNASPYSIPPIIIDDSGLSSYDNNGIFVYPNPTNDQVYIKLNDYSGEDVRIHLYDIQGNVLVSDNLQNNLNFSVEHLPPGIYMLEIDCNDFIETVKLSIID
ncbi:MAG: T9SS type A sorting domain-containing protein [Crocinitomicaceae bacterium]